MDMQKVVTAVIWIVVGLALESGAFQGASPVPAEEAVQQRAEEFYSLLLSNRVTDGEAYVTQDTLENYKRLRSNPFQDFEVKSVELDSEGTSAKVETTIMFFIAQAGQELPYRRLTNWRLENGEWRMIVPNPIRRPIERVSQGPPALEFRENRIDLGIFTKDEKKQARFFFTNVTDSPIEISEVATGCTCLTPTYEQNMYGPGESGELVIEFDPAKFRSLYGQTIEVKTEPGGRSHLLSIKAEIMPSGWRPPGAKKQ